jgi:PAS domain S-box-containing protein
MLSDENRYRLLVDSITDYAIFMLNERGEVSSWNAGAQRIKGYSESEILGKHFSQFSPEEDRAAGVPKAALETAEREGRWEKEGWRVRKDGSQFFAHVIIDSIHNEEGKLIGFAKVTRDITERMQTQQALEQSQRALFQSQKLESLGHLTVAFHSTEVEKWRDTLFRRTSYRRSLSRCDAGKR